MSKIAMSLVLFCLAVVDDKPSPKLPVGKETTYITGPIDKEGYLDYEAALNDRLGQGITPEKNANVLLWKALGPRPEGGEGMPAEFFRRLGMEEPPAQGDYFIGLSTYLKDHLKVERGNLDEFYDQQTRVSRRPWTAKDYPDIAAWLKANEKPLATAVEATRRPEYFNPLVTRRTGEGRGSLIGALLPGVQKCRELANALSARAMLRVGEGKPDEAWQDLLACHRLGQLLSRGGTLIEALVGIAIDSIASNADLAYLQDAPLNAQQVRDRLKDLQGLAPFPPVADKIDLTERFAYLETVQLIRRGGVGMLEGLAGGTPPKKPSPEELQALAKIDWEPALRTGNQWYDRLAAALRNPDRAKREKALDKIEHELQALKAKTSNRTQNLVKLFLGVDQPAKTAGKAIGDVLVTLMIPAARKVQQAHDRAEQVDRNLHVAFALAAYQREHGRYPAKLEELAPKYLASVPGDLFSGKPLIYRPSEKGYLLYSVGPNGKDDGGRWYDDDPPGDDPSVRMPLPELKRKP